MDTIVINDLFSAIFNVLYFAVILATIFIVILDNRNPVKTMAWILVLFFLPIVGLVFYFFFGQNTRKERLISRKGYSRLNKRPLAEYQAQESLKEQTIRMSRGEYSKNPIRPTYSLPAYFFAFTITSYLLPPLYFCS